MKIPIHYCNGCTMEYIGYIELETFNADRCYHICNWSTHKGAKRPHELFADISHTVRGMCFTNPETNEIWMPLSIGWLHGNEKLIKDFVRENAGKKLWLGGLDEEYSM